MNLRVLASRNPLEQMTTIKSRQKQYGFTVTEIVIVMAIIGILGAVATPSFLAWLPGYRLKSAVRDLQGHLQTAKYEAVQRSGNVAVNFNPPPAPPCGCVNCYQIFVDDGNPPPQAPPTGVAGNQQWEGVPTDPACRGNEVMLRQVNMPTNITLTGATGNLTFTSRGIPNVGATITLQNNQNTRGRAQITAVGRVNIERSTDNGATWQQWD
jgi:type IV fimbrial biogenesis protein FimT